MPTLNRFLHSLILIDALGRASALSSYVVHRKILDAQFGKHSINAGWSSFGCKFGYTPIRSFDMHIFVLNYFSEWGCLAQSPAWRSAIFRGAVGFYILVSSKDLKR